MSITEKYLEALSINDGWITVSQWAEKFGEMFPDLLEKAHNEAINQKTPSTGLREIAARISSNISRGAYTGLIEIDESERPRRVRRLTAAESENYIEKEIEDDLEPLTRSQKIKNDIEALSTKDRYRLSEFENIIDQLRSLFSLDFELDHAKALLNSTDPGSHHPDNIQILLKAHNRNKGVNNWPRFTFEEQVAYLRANIHVQRLVASRMGVDITEDVIESIIKRLELIY